MTGIFPEDAPAADFLHVPSWPGPFDVEIDCVAVFDPAEVPSAGPERKPARPRADQLI